MVVYTRKKCEFPYLIVHLEVQQVDGAALALEVSPGLPDDVGDEALELVLLAKQVAGQFQQEL